MLELRSLKYGAVIETPTSFKAAASLTTRIPKCPTCQGHVESKGRAAPMEVWDTPMGGKHVRYEFTARLYRCSTPGCKAFTDRGPDIHPKHGLSWRLWHCIQRMALKRSIKDIERLTGATPEQIAPVIDELIKRLAKHTFETPRMSAIHVRAYVPVASRSPRQVAPPTDRRLEQLLAPPAFDRRESHTYPSDWGNC